MPTYAYRCSTCSHEFETAQRFSDDPLTVCPECGGPLRKVFHPVGIVFKGSGWYINDSRKTESGPAKKATSETKGEGASASTSESAPAAEAKPDKPAEKATSKAAD